MRRAAMVLGLIGGTGDFVFGAVSVVASQGPRTGFLDLRQLALFVGVVFLAVGVVAVIGATQTRKRPILGGVLMIIAALPHLVLQWVGLLMALVLVTGGILALVGAKELKTATPAPEA